MSTRRRFLYRLGGAAAALTAGLHAHRAPAAVPGGGRPCNVVVVLAYGGWDAMWALDPKPDSPEVDRIPGDVQNFGELPIWTHPDRPAVTQFFTDWGSRTAVINGIGVDSLAHETCAKMMLAGGLGERPDVAALVGAELGRELPLPYLALSAQAKMHGLEEASGRLGASNQLMALSTPEFGWPAEGQSQPDVGLGLVRDEQLAIREFLDLRARRWADGVAASPRSQTQADDYLASLGRANALQDVAADGGYLADLSLFETTDAPWEHVAAALAGGVSRSAMIQPELFWDTHSDNASQGTMHEQFFGALNALMAALSTRGVLDETVVLVASEMGRTPRHNAQGGKDHWPWTSAMLVGPGVAGGRAYGRTDEWLQPSPVDLATGMADPAGTPLHGGHVLSAVAELVGVDRGPEWFGREAYRALLA